MADLTARKQQLAADLDELRTRAATARTDLKALPAAGARNASQKATAKTLRFELLVARIVLNALGTPAAGDLDDAS